MDFSVVYILKIVGRFSEIEYENVVGLSILFLVINFELIFINY